MTIEDLYELTDLCEKIIKVSDCLKAIGSSSNFDVRITPHNDERYFYSTIYTYGDSKLSEISLKYLNYIKSLYADELREYMSQFVELDKKIKDECK